MQLARAKEWTDVLTPIAGAIALIAGGVFGVVQYLDKKHDDRVKETLNFFDRYNDDAVLAARTNLVDTWRKHAAEQESVIDQPGDAFNIFALRVIKAENLKGSISVINDFFAALDICTRNGICDCDVSLQLFQPDARSFYHQHYAFLIAERKRAKDPTIGAGLEAFAKIGRNLPAGAKPDCTKAARSR